MNKTKEYLEYVLCSQKIILQISGKLDECFWPNIKFLKLSLFYFSYEVKVKVAQLCSTLCDHTDYTVHGILQAGQNPGVGSLSLLQGIFPTQGWNPGLPHCGQIFTSWATKEAQE